MLVVCQNQHYWMRKLKHALVKHPLKVFRLWVVIQPAVLHNISPKSLQLDHDHHHFRTLRLEFTMVTVISGGNISHCESLSQSCPKVWTHSHLLHSCERKSNQVFGAQPIKIILNLGNDCPSADLEKCTTSPSVQLAPEAFGGAELQRPPPSLRFFC